MGNKIMYKTKDGWEKPTITKVEVTKTTNSSVWVKNKSGCDMSARRISNYECYFDTFEEAKEYLSNNLTDKLKKLTNTMIDIQNRLDALAEITETNVK